MIVAELIRKKRDGLELTVDEINFIVAGAATGAIPDYQLSAWLMAVFFKGLSSSETFALTRGIKDSGQSYDWKTLRSELRDAVLVDKHSTGGVGDKVSLVLVPLAIELGMKVPMISGRGLGHTGGTVDKLLSIPGFKMSFTADQAAALLVETGACLLSQTDALCPADKKFYHLRDVTATIESYPLIAASIVSKKWAEGCETLLFDVKYGTGAFMLTRELATELGNWLLAVSRLAGIKSGVALTRMDEPLGACIGNALEVKESVWILKNEYPSDAHREIARPLRNLCCELTANLAALAGVTSFESALQKCQSAIDTGRAFTHFDRVVRAQGGEANWCRAMPETFAHEIRAKSPGFVRAIKSREVGLLGIEIGAGRKRVDEAIHNANGFEILAAIGTKVEAGDVVARVHCEQKPSPTFSSELLSCFECGDQPFANPKGSLVWNLQ